MARGINKVIIVGNLGKDPEVRATASGSTVTSLTIATSEQWTDKQSGQKQEKTEWHRIVLFGKLGDIAGQYLKKGSQAYIEGRLQTREWEKDGIKRHNTEIIASDMQMLGGGSGTGGQASSSAAAQPAQPAASDYDDGDDIPF